MGAVPRLLADQEAVSCLLAYPASRIGSWEEMEVIWKKLTVGGGGERKRKRRYKNFHSAVENACIKIAPDTTL